MKHTITIETTGELPRSDLSDRYHARTAVYGPRPQDVSGGGRGDEHGGLEVEITGNFYLLFGDKRFTGPERGYGTLAEQAEVARNLIGILADIAGELERRAQAEAERGLPVDTEGGPDDEDQDDPTDHDPDRDRPYLACCGAVISDAEADMAPVGSRQECPRHGETTVLAPDGSSTLVAGGAK